jgi:hypothetical protein
MTGKLVMRHEFGRSSPKRRSRSLPQIPVISMATVASPSPGATGSRSSCILEPVSDLSRSLEVQASTDSRGGGLWGHGSEC